MMMFETSKHVPKTEKRCCVFKNNMKRIEKTEVILESEVKWSEVFIYRG